MIICYRRSVSLLTFILKKVLSVSVSLKNHWLFCWDKRDFKDFKHKKGIWLFRREKSLKASYLSTVNKISEFFSVKSMSTVFTVILILRCPLVINYYVCWNSFYFIFTGIFTLVSRGFFSYLFLDSSPITPVTWIVGRRRFLSDKYGQIFV